jgi:membrane associated rhomboid family serine protease
MIFFAVGGAMEMLSSSLWLIPLTKLIGLIIVVPFAITYLHLQHEAFWKNEYCFVGPYETLFDFSTTMIVNVNDNGIDNKIRVDEKSDVTTITTPSVTFKTLTGQRYHGIYAPTSSSKKPEEKRQFQQRYSSSNSNTPGGGRSSFFSWTVTKGWSSITQMATMISLTNVMTPSEPGIIAFQGDKWCLNSSSLSGKRMDVNKTTVGRQEMTKQQSWCSEILYPNEIISNQYPPSGIWKAVEQLQSPSGGELLHSRMRITCAYPPSSSSSTTINKSNKGGQQLQNGKQNENLHFILNKPSTTILLLLNIGLAYHYWNQRIDPSCISKIYNRIIQEHEWWRGLTGATAHFEPLHIGFNLMSLQALGKDIEGNMYSSIVFLIYNIALVVFTTMVMMLMTYVRICWYEREIKRLSSSTSSSPVQLQYDDKIRQLKETSSIGYSAVLFAWMVIQTMESNRPSCPIPFFSDVCFETYSMPILSAIKFNIAPIVSLFAAQFIMPRVSFMGHLSGIICGYGLHWGLFPPLEVCCPNVLFGGVFLIGLIWRRRIIPVRPLLTATMDEEGGMEHENYLTSLLAAVENGGDEMVGVVVGDNSSHRSPSSQSNNNNRQASSYDPILLGKQRKKERDRIESYRKQKTLLYIRNLIGVVTVLSLFVFDWTSSLILSQFVLLSLFAYGSKSLFIVWAYTRSEVENDIILPEKKRSGIIWRGLLMSTVISIVYDSMTFASWFAVPNVYSPLPIGALSIKLFMIFRLVINLLALVVCSKILHELGEVGGGIFVHVFSFVIDWTRAVGDSGVLALHPLVVGF